MTEVEILKAGMVTGVGLDWPSSSAAIRCGITGFEETRFTFDGEWQLGCEVPLDEAWRGREKLLRMAVLAIRECLGALDPHAPNQVPLLLCLAEDGRPGRKEGLDDSMLDAIQDRLDIRFHPWSRVFTDGRVGGIQALDYSRRVLARNRPRCIVAGVDSLLVGSTLASFHQRHRLLTPENSDGFVPGEAGAALLIGPVGSGGPLRCLGVGYGQEQATIEAEQPLRGNGLTAAVKAALSEAGLTMGDLDYRLSDVSGEQYGFKEANLALAQTLRQQKPEFDIWHTADCIGEVGAAVLPCLLGVGMFAVQKGYAPGSGAVCHVGNDEGSRAAVVLLQARNG